MCSGDPSTWGLVMSSCLAWGTLICSQMSMLRLRDWALCSLGSCLRAVLGGFTVAMPPERSYERHCPFAKGLQRRTMTITLASQIHNNHLAHDCDRTFFFAVLQLLCGLLSHTTRYSEGKEFHFHMLVSLYHHFRSVRGTILKSVTHLKFCEIWTSLSSPNITYLFGPLRSLETGLPCKGFRFMH